MSGVQKFENYLLGVHFFLETDHHPLQYLQSAKFQNGRVMRWSLILQPYRFTVRAIKGSDNVDAFPRAGPGHLTLDSLLHAINGQTVIADK